MDLSGSSSVGVCGTRRSNQLLRPLVGPPHSRFSSHVWEEGPAKSSRRSIVRSCAVRPPGRGSNTVDVQKSFKAGALRCRSPTRDFWFGAQPSDEARVCFAPCARPRGGPFPLPSIVTQFTSAPCLEEPEEATFFNPVCFPDVVLEDLTEDDLHRIAAVRGPLPPSCPLPAASPLFASEDAALLPTPLTFPSPRFSFEFLSDSQREPEIDTLLQRGAAAAVSQAEESYRRAWRELQDAEARLKSTQQLVAELDLLPALPSPEQLDLLGDAVAPARPLASLALLAGAEFVGSEEDDFDEVGGSVPPAIGGEWEGSTSGKGHMSGHDDHARALHDVSASDEIAAMRSKAILDEAARQLLRRLKEEEDIQGRVIDHHIEMLDQGGQYHVASWLVDEMAGSCPMEGSFLGDTKTTRSILGECSAVDMDTGSPLKHTGRDRGGNECGDLVARLAVPVDLGLASEGYDEHAVRFLRHLPFDTVLKIRTIPPSSTSPAHSGSVLHHHGALDSSPLCTEAVAAVAEALERIVAQRAAARLGDIGPSSDASPPGVSEPIRSTSHSTMALLHGAPSPPLLPSPSSRDSLLLPPGKGKQEYLGAEVEVHPMVEVERDLDEADCGLDGARGRGETEALRWSGLREAHSSLLQSRRSVGDHLERHRGHRAKLVLLGCGVCAAAAYMVLNFDLLALAKDVYVILIATSLVMLAARFVWRGHEGENLGHAVGDLQRAAPAPCASSGSVRHKKRTPKWDQAIWLIGGVAVVLSLSTMLALAAKAVQSGLTALSLSACSLVLRLTSFTAPGHAAALSAPTAAALVRHVSTSLWLVLGGEVATFGIESLGLAAAWAMLLLCVALSIVSAPACLAASTSRRVGALFALSRSGPPAHRSLL